jgi:hypothetical protein
MRRRAAGVLAVVLVWGVAACSSDGDPGTAASATPGATASSAPGATASATPDVCASADELRTSIDGLRDVQVVEDGTAALEQVWTTVQDDWAQLGADLRETHAERVASVQSAAEGVRDALAEAQGAPSAAALRDVGAGIAAFVTDARALLDEVGTTC